MKRSTRPGILGRGLGQEQSRNNIPKKIAYASAYSALYRWSLVSGAPAFEGLAEKVPAGEAVSKRQVRQGMIVGQEVNKRI